MNKEQFSFSEQVLISDPEAFKEKQRQFLEKGYEGMHVLTDFDRTLTKGYLDGKRTPSIISQLRDGHFLSEAYAKEAHALFDHYHPIEIDSSIPLDQRSKAMDEWWMKHFQLLFDSGLTYQVLEQVANERKRIFRPGAIETMKLCLNKNIPLIIMSASLGDMIKIYLKQEGLESDFIHVVSNNFIFDASGKVIDVQKPIVHSLNKSEVVLQQVPEVFNQVKDRKNVLLMGDGLGDLGMVDGFSADTVLSVGFYNDTDPKAIAEYKAGYDILITGDASMQPVQAFLASIEEHEKTV